MGRSGLEGNLSFSRILTVELEGEGVRAAVPTDFKAAFELDSLENIVVFLGGGDEAGWV